MATIGVSLLRGLGVALSALALVGACSGDDGPERRRLAKLAEACSINSDCQSPLVCVFERCHVECKESRDCPAGSRCVLTGGDIGVCLLDDEVKCKSPSDCPGKLICAVDLECRAPCVSKADCTPEQVCADGACADAAELINGHLPGADAGTGGSGGVVGSGGSGGVAGSGGSGGVAGSGGSGGSGGVAGSGGVGGTAGASGSSGTGGTAGLDGGTDASAGSGGVAGDASADAPWDGAGVTLPKPVSYWPLNAIGGATPDSVGAHHGHFDGAATQTAGQVGQAVTFNVTGTSQRGVIPHEGSLTTLTTLAVSVWFKPAVPLTGNIFMPFVSKTNTFQLGYETGGLVFQIKNISGTVSTAKYTTTVAANQWHHLAGSYDATSDDVLHLYLDGAEVATVAGTGSINTADASPLYFAFHQAGIYADYFFGSVDDVAFYKAPLSATQVAALYAAGSAKLSATNCASCPAPTAHWRLDVSPDPAVPDALAKNSGATIHGPLPVAGKVGEALRFHHGADYAQIPNSASLNPTANLSVAFWARPASNLDNASPFLVLVGKQSWSFDVGLGQPLRFGIAGASASFTNPLWKDTWYHLAGTWDGTTKALRFYIDGKFVQQAIASGPASPSSAALLFSDSQFALGTLDEVVVYDATLTDAQVKQLYDLGNAGLPIPTN